VFRGIRAGEPLGRRVLYVFCHGDKYGNNSKRFIFGCLDMGRRHTLYEHNVTWSRSFRFQFLHVPGVLRKPYNRREYPGPWCVRLRRKKHLCEQLTNAPAASSTPVATAVAQYVPAPCVLTAPPVGTLL
jgi:hypothetical protein